MTSRRGAALSDSRLPHETCGFGGPDSSSGERMESSLPFLELFFFKASLWLIS